MRHGLIGVERENRLNPYEIGVIDVYSNPATGDLGGSYLTIADFPDSDSAIAYANELQAEMDEQEIPVYEIATFAENKAFERQPEPANWRSASAEEYASYEYMRDLGLFDADDPPDTSIEPLIQTALELGGVVELELDDDTAFQALQRIGIDTEDFNPDDNPPPYRDEQTGTAYWIGIFQPDKDDPENCVTSILSLGQNSLILVRWKHNSRPVCPAIGTRPMVLLNTSSKLPNAVALSRSLIPPRAWHWQPTSATNGKLNGACNSLPNPRLTLLI